MAGAPVGNQNARHGVEWRQAINRALEKRGNGDRSKALQDLAESFLDSVEELAVSTEKRSGSIAGYAELGNRLDGPPAQSVVLGGDSDNPLVTRIERVVVDPGKQDGNTSGKPDA